MHKTKDKLIYVFGHINPDTDSICSAIAYANLKQVKNLDNYIAARLGEVNKETDFALKYFNIKPPILIEDVSGKDVVLVDHNDKAQSGKGIETAQILEIIDHHPITNLTTKLPIYIHTEPVGSTATLIYKKYLNYGITPGKEMAGIMLSGLLSDTRNLTSPTTTKEDKLVAAALAQLGNIQGLQAYGKKMLQAGSSLKGLTPAEIIGLDKKEFNFNGLKTVISHVNTYNHKEIMAKKEMIIQALDTYLLETNSHLGVFAVSDLENISTILIAGGESKGLIHKMFNTTKDIITINKLLSRKTDIVPNLLKILEQS